MAELYAKIESAGSDNHLPSTDHRRAGDIRPAQHPFRAPLRWNAGPNGHFKPSEGDLRSKMTSKTLALDSAASTSGIYRDDPNDTYLSRLHHAAFGLAVYASQAPLRDWPTQDSLPAGGQPLPGRTHTCRAPSERFRLC